MKQLFFYTVILFFFSFLATSCANIIPPGGGPKDSLPPKLVAAFPKDSTTNFFAKKITLTFNEYIEVKDALQQVLMNPTPENMPIIDFKLKNVTIALKDDLEPNTTYNINFGSSIADVNEGNIYKNFTYVFSTGKKIDYNTIKGTIVEASTENIDSTLIVVLHKNLNDSAVLKLKPNYISKVNAKGEFYFSNLPSDSFNIYVLPNTFTKKYDDSTAAFAFSNKPINFSASSNQNAVLTYFKLEAKPKTVVQTFKNDKKLKFTTNTTSGRFNILDSGLILNFEKKLIVKNKQLIQLLDSNFNKIEPNIYTIDTVVGLITFKQTFSFGTKYHIIIDKAAFTDIYNNSLFKTDTLKFETFSLKDYGNIKIRCNKFDVTKNPVIQIVKDNIILASYPVIGKEVIIPMFNPGEYDIRVLFDTNKNGIWDAGNFKLKKQPEKVISIKTKLPVKANWDNELEITL